MIIKKSLKFALPAMLLAVSASAFAEEQQVVTLGNSSTITWSQFVEHLADPSLAGIKGEELGETHPAVQALAVATAKVERLQVTAGEKKDAKDLTDEALQAAEEAYNQAVADKEAADGVVATKNGELTAAKEAVATAQANVDNYVATVINGVAGENGCETDGVKTIYDKAEAQLVSWNNQLSECNSNGTYLNGQVSVYDSNIKKAEKERDAKQKALDDLEKVTSTTTTTVYPDWLTPMLNNANKCLSAWTGYTTDWVDRTMTIYYKIITTTNPKTKVKTRSIILAFSNPNEDGWVTETSTDKFYDALFDITGEGEDIDYTPIKFTSKSLYLGANLTDLNGDEVTNTTITLTTSENEEILPAAVTSLNNLTNSDSYKRTTTESKTEVKDKNAEAKAKKELEDAQQAVDDLEEEKADIIDQITANNALIKSLQAQVDGYTKTKNANGLTQQQQLKKNWDDAATTGQQDVNDKLQKAKDDQEKVQEELNAAEKAVTSKTNDVTVKSSAVAKAQAAAAANDTAYENALAAVDSAKDEETLAQKNKDAAQEAENLAAFKKVYYTINLNADVEATVPVTVEEFDGTIFGNGHVITNAIADGSHLFTGTFVGKLNNAAVNGVFSKSTSNNMANAVFEKVVYWPNDGTPGKYYDENSADKFESMDLGELGFQIRNHNYGVDFAKNIVTDLTDATRVYSITVKPVAGAAQQYYVTVKGDKFISAKELDGFTIPTNLFAESATEDLLDIDGIANVYFSADGVNGISKKVVITDRKDFYCPIDIHADVVEYTREFVAGQNAVCLPFALYHDLSKYIRYLSTYSSEDDDRFWFNKIEQGVSIDANKPALLVASQKFSFTGANALKDIDLLATPQSQLIAVDSDDDNDESRSWGIFKQCGRDNFIGSANAYRVYGLTTEGTFKPAGEGAQFPALRMVISSAIAPKNAPARRIGVRNEFGEDVTDELGITSIDGVNAEATGVSVEGGKGEIIITAEAAKGDVAIYTVDGKMIAVADVVAGTTTVKAQTGVYVVMGKKVMVK